MNSPPLDFIPNRSSAESAGFRFGAVGTHSSRTLMFAELRGLLDAGATLARDDYRRLAVEDNLLGKPTTSTRKITFQRLSELYGFAPEMPLFRLLTKLWVLGEAARPQLALLVALARDPLLRASATPIPELTSGADFPRHAMAEAIRHLTEDRLNPAILDKVLRNCASSWSQAGFFEGRTFKRRTKVTATFPSITLALALGRLSGFGGAQLFASPWVGILDTSPTQARELALEAKRHGLLDLRLSGDVVDMDFSRLDPVFSQIS
jgi:hypothetical protein